MKYLGMLEQSCKVLPGPPSPGKRVSSADAVPYQVGGGVLALSGGSAQQETMENMGDGSTGPWRSSGGGVPPSLPSPPAPLQACLPAALLLAPSVLTGPM